MTTDPRVPVIAPTVTEQAVAADEQRIAIELVDTVIRDLFGVGLTLQSAMPHIRGPAEQPVNAAIDDIDRIIRTIRDVVFDLAASEVIGVDSPAPAAGDAHSNAGIGVPVP